jgi:hypothetical protein
MTDNKATPWVQRSASLQCSDGSAREPNTNQLEIDQPVKRFASYINAVAKRGEAAASEIIAYWPKLGSRVQNMHFVRRYKDRFITGLAVQKMALKAFSGGGFKVLSGGFSARIRLFVYCMFRLQL